MHLATVVPSTRPTPYVLGVRGVPVITDEMVAARRWAKSQGHADVLSCDQQALLRSFLAHLAEQSGKVVVREAAQQIVVVETKAVVVAKTDPESLLEAALAAEARGDLAEAERLFQAACS